MKRVTGIGGIFFRAQDPAALQAWGGAAFPWTDGAGVATGGTTIWSVGDGGNFAAGKSFMVNYRVEDVHALVAALRD